MVASLTLVGGCSQGPNDDGSTGEGQPETVTVTSTSSSTSPQETHTETVTATETATETVAPTSGTTSTTSSGPDDEGPEQAVEDFGQALKDRDFETVCSAIDPELVTALEQSTQGQSCAEAMKDNEEELTGDIGEDDQINIIDSTIADDEQTATVTVRSKDDQEEDLKMKKVDDEWKITFE